MRLLPKLVVLDAVSLCLLFLHGAAFLSARPSLLRLRRQSGGRLWGYDDQRDPFFIQTSIDYFEGYSVPGTDLESLPIWPTPDMATVPFAGIREVRVIEPRYLKLVKELRETGKDEIGFVFLDQKVSPIRGFDHSLGLFGTVMNLEQVEETPMGYRLMLRAKERFRLVQVSRELSWEKCMKAMVERDVEDDDRKVRTEETEASMELALSKLRELIELTKQGEPNWEALEEAKREGLEVFSFTLMACFQQNMPGKQRQELIQRRSGASRLASLQKMVDRTISWKKKQMAGLYD